MKSKTKRQHPLQWILEPLESEASFFQKHMFGCQAAYIYGRLFLVLADKDEPWYGLLVCTSHEFHADLMHEHPGLHPHPVLPKWLYLSRWIGDFEETAQQLVLQVLKNDGRIGVEPSARGRKRPRKAKNREHLRAPGD